MFQHHRLFPNERYFKRLKEIGIPVVFNSDAHYPDLINAGRMEAMTIYNNLWCWNIDLVFISAIMPASLMASITSSTRLAYHGSSSIPGEK